MHVAVGAVGLTTSVALGHNPDIPSHQQRATKATLPRTALRRRGQPGPLRGHQHGLRGFRRNLVGNPIQVHRQSKRLAYGL